MVLCVWIRNLLCDLGGPNMMRRNLLPLTKLRALTVSTLVTFLCACTGAPAPSPQINLTANHKELIRITVERSVVTSVQVQSNWVVGDISCAPVIWPAGNSRIKQVSVDENVTKEGDVYLATVLSDRFNSGKCRWSIGGVSIHFMRGNKVLSSEAVPWRDLSVGTVDKVTCDTSLRVSPGICHRRDLESVVKSEDRDAFNAEMELAHE